MRHVFFFWAEKKISEIYQQFRFWSKKKLQFFFEIQYLEKCFFSLKFFSHQKYTLSFNSTESLVAEIFCFRVMIFRRKKSFSS